MALFFSLSLSQQPTTFRAGDTVAAGTLASWQYLLQKEKCLWLNERIRSSLISSTARNENNVDFVATAFMFGLACGSASCLEPENSVFCIDCALRLFDRIGITAQTSIV